MAISQPEIFNTDQGGQFTSKDFTGKLESCGIQISMDGRGRAFDNIFIERLWRSVKYEDAYAKNYESVRDAVADLTRYFRLIQQREATRVSWIPDAARSLLRRQEQ